MREALRLCQILSSEKDLCIYKILFLQVFNDEILKQTSQLLFLDYGSEVQDILMEKSGQKTVPNVYINSEHVGDASKTFALHSSGELLALINKSTHNYDYDLVSDIFVCKKH